MRKFQNLIESLRRFGVILPQLVADVSSDDARWRPVDGSWSILEVVSHLCDEEEYDFRARVRSTLETPERPWDPIDPPGWAVERRYNERELATEAARFQQLRASSVTWLRSLDNPDWSRTHLHPKFGPLNAGELFAAWVAHDQLHLRQIAKRQFQMIQRDAEPYSTHYAGDWTA
jgi:hypothetical protein